MKLWRDLLNNQVLMASVIGWLVAQALKTIIDFAFNKEFRAERLTGSGGMPSSHSATVCALATSTGYRCGVSSFEFAVSFVLAAVVMYDAIGVRRETGKQAKLLNTLMQQEPFKLDGEEFQVALKEFVGHTPMQVLVGAALGVLVAVLFQYR
ncbi:MAG: divergent PAP2 family protein [Lachnospiraceae bacterium]|jgi:acid phosphatase family membrane protein YuiD|nr:divergent PAP2 family protein [Lachnospiraceae bacterium]